jgi:hypothetical protein
MTDFSFTDAGSFGSDFTGGGDSGGGIFGTGISNSQAVGLFGGLTGAAGSLISGNANSAAAQATASGYAQEAALYTQAAQIAGQDVGITAAEGETAVAQKQRQIEMTEATGQAATAGGGFDPFKGTAGDILRSSQQQAALIIGQQKLQTTLQENEFKQMQTSFEAQSAGATAAEQAAQAQASSAKAGGIIDAIGGIAKGILGFL